MFRVIIAGSRSFNDYDLLCKTMDHLLSKKGNDITIIGGKAKGADELGEQYAIDKGYIFMPFPADWERNGKRAGYMRNEEMANNADALVAFWDGESRGTAHMIKTAQKKGLQIRIKRFDPEHIC